MNAKASRARTAGLLVLSLTLASSLAEANLTTARTSVNHGEYAAAEADLASVRGRDRPLADVLLGRIYLETGRAPEARALAERLVRVPTTRVQGLTLLGESLVAVGEYATAVARWSDALRASPGAQSYRARALLTVWQSRLGHRDDARETANGLLDAYNDAVAASESGGGRRTPAVLRDADFLTYVGMATRALASPRDANQAFNDALAVDPQRVETNLEQAELMVATEDLGPAGEAITTALTTNPHSARGLVMRARARLISDLDFVRAGEDLTAALAVDPRSVAARVLRGSIVLRDGDIAGADRAVNEALAINPRDPEALALRGVVRFVANDVPGFRRAFDALFEAVPTYAEGYDMVAEFADWEHRYAEAIELLRDGLARPSIAADRKLQARIRANLGINLLRMGREEDALPELRASFEQSRFNVRVANLLNLYEQTLPAEYEREDDAPFRFRYHRSEHAVMRRYTPALLHTAYDDMVRRYHFTPEGPLSIELYASTENFSVRTSGLPEIGVQGVCFGRVVTALSPHGGPFNWAQVVWHELAHVFAIQMSHSRVPRWFTEGLSEWEAFHSHPDWAREDDPALYRALVAGRVPRVEDFNTAFTHARQSADMLVAYYAASKLVEFIIDRYGFDRAISMLPMWGRGMTTAEAIQQGLGVAPAVLDRDFRAATMARLARYANAFAVDPGDYRDRAALTALADGHPNDATAQERAAAAAYFDRDAAAATRYAARAVSLDVGSLVAHWVRAEIAVHTRHGREALDEIDPILAAGKDGYELRVLEARAARLAPDNARFERALAAASRADPTQVDAHRLLATVHHRAHREADRVRELREVVRLDQHDREGLSMLVRAMYSAQMWPELAALRDRVDQLDPMNVAEHIAVAHALSVTGARDPSAFELETAIALNPPNVQALRDRLAAVRRGDAGLAPLPLPPASREESGDEEGPAAPPTARPPRPPTPSGPRPVT